jgi:hypothetical protein
LAYQAPRNLNVDVITGRKRRQWRIILTSKVKRDNAVGFYPAVAYDDLNPLVA